MATSYKVLGQSIPTANTLTSAYTVPSLTEAVISTIAVCNLGPAPTTYKIAVIKDGGSVANEDYIVYDATIAPQDTMTFTLGLTLNAADEIDVESFNGLVSFNIFGSEIA
jgi:hypothetical protein